MVEQRTFSRSEIEAVLEEVLRRDYGERFIGGYLDANSCECCGTLIEYEFRLREEKDAESD